MTTLQIKVQMPEIGDMLVAAGWIGQEDVEDPAAIGMGALGCLAAWLADPARDPYTLPRVPCAQARQAPEAARCRPGDRPAAAGLGPLVAR
jgi:hypothetical protein